MRRGGQNKRNGCVEEQRRIDSFETKYSSFMLDGFKMLPFQRDDDSIIVSGTRIQLSFMYNAAGLVPFFLCPVCNARVRFLYLPAFACRRCSQLNYKCQQLTKGTFQELIQLPDQLEVERPVQSWIDADDYELPRPRYMHKKRFTQYQKRFEKHKQRFIERDLKFYFRVLGNSGFWDEFSDLIDEAWDDD
ncbi:MAG: hypothetical protein II845_03250 [Oscillospiraceae bacterium]|nr:hypothetical protein [Oscillospiraceae bacterium]